MDRPREQGVALAAEIGDVQVGEPQSGIWTATGGKQIAMPEHETTARTETTDHVIRETVTPPKQDVTINVDQNRARGKLELRGVINASGQQTNGAADKETKEKAGEPSS